jgi:hypothetical protein
MERTSNGQFKLTAKGEKTCAMREVEANLGRTLEEDFQEFYVEKGWGQKRIAQRWQTQRPTIFATNKHGGRRSWVQILALPVRRDGGAVAEHQRKTVPRSRCEICGDGAPSLDNAHWISAREGGSTVSYNILRLCPNCHRRLDRDDPATMETAKEVLLFRVVKKIIETGPDTEAKRKKLMGVSECILNRSNV